MNAYVLHCRIQIRTEEEDEEASFRESYRDPTSAFSDLLDAAPAHDDMPDGDAASDAHDGVTEEGNGVGEPGLPLDAAVRIAAARSCCSLWTGACWWHNCRSL